MKKRYLGKNGIKKSVYTIDSMQIKTYSLIEEKIMIFQKKNSMQNESNEQIL